MRFRLLILSAFVLTALAGPIAAHTQARRPMTFDDLMKMRRLGDTDVSPDGKWLVYSVTDVDLAKNTKTATLWIQPVSPEKEAGGEAKRLEGTEPGDGGAKFSHDGTRILFLSSRERGQQVWMADFDGATGVAGTPRKLSSIATEADNAIWAPDGHSIVFTSAVYPDCAPILPADPAGNTCNADRDKELADSKVKARIFDHLLYKHWNAFTGDKRSHLFQLNVEDRAVRDLTPNDPHDVPPFSLEGGCGCAISPDSRELAFTENLDEEPAISTNADIFTLDLSDGRAKPVKVSTSPGGDFSPAYSPDGKYLAWRSQARAGYESDKFRLMLYDRGSKSIKDLLPNFDRWVDEFAWDRDSKSIYFVAGDRGRAPIFKVALEGSKLLHTVESDSGGEIGGIHVLPDYQTLVVSRMKVNQPGEVFALRNAPGMSIDPVINSKAMEKSFPSSGGEFVGKAAEQITHLNDEHLSKLDLEDMESFLFVAQDGKGVQGFLIRPPGFDASKKYPVKFLIHGGPQGAWGDSWSYRWNAELLAANGYVVIMINPRGSTGYGQAFVDGVNGDWGGKPFTDLMLGLDYAEKTYPFIDKNRECALGASYGGYMANWVLGHTDRFKCIVTHDGMFDPESAYGSTEELWFNEWEFKGKPWDYYGKPDSENPFRKWAPMLYAKNFKTPTLVIHSQLDYRLDVSEGYQLFTTLQRLKVPSKMLYFPDEGHWVMKPQNSKLWYKTVNDWVDEWTKGRD